MALRRAFFLALVGLAGLLLLVGLLLGWTVTTESGLRFAARMAEKALPGSLTLERPAGTLSGSFKLGRVVYETDEQGVVLEDATVDWKPRSLLDGLLHIERLDIGRIRFASAAKKKESQPPQDLTLPLAVRVDLFRVGEILSAPRDGKEPDPDPLVSGLSGSFASDGTVHRFQNVQVATARLGIQAEGSLDGRPPFPVTASGQIRGEELGHPFTVAVDARGNLRALGITARSASGGLTVNGEAILDAFAPQPVRQATLTASGLDPAAWVEGAPHARLAIDARISPAPGKAESLAGKVAITNGQPGRIDQEKVPLRRLEAQVRQEGTGIAIPAFTAAFEKGKATGKGVWADGKLIVDTELAGVDASAWHKALTATSLSGALRAEASAASQRVEADLRDPRFRLRLDAERKEGLVRISTARLASGTGSLELVGQLDPGGKYDLKGRLRNFDPSVLVQVPRGQLNAALDATGQLGEKPTMDLEFALQDSRWAGLPLTGRGDVVLRPDRLEAADIRLRAGGNRIEARGALGNPGDRLKLAIDAPRLEQMGLGGSVSGEATLSGPLRSPGAEWSLASPGLTLPDGTRLVNAASQGRMEPGAAAIGASFLVETLKPAGDLPTVSDISLRIEGQRSRHRLTATARVGKDHALEVAAQGGLEADRLWKGRLETFSWTGPNPVRLAEGTRLEAGPGRIVLGEAAITGDGWRATVDGLSWRQGQLQTAGRFSNLPVAPFLPAAAPATTLRLGGEWKVDFGRKAAGRVRIFREQGDLVLRSAGEAVPLGLERLSLAADFSGTQVEVTVAGRGTRAGTLDGRLTAGLRQERGQWTLARHSPWRGQFGLDTPSIAWLSPLAGENIVLGGRLQGDVRVAGTPADPAVNGEVSGSGLRVRLLDYGLDLGGGSLLLEFTPEVARLQRLELVSVATQRPSQRRIDFRRLTAEPGRLVAEGQISLKDGSGRIRLTAHQLAVSQLPDRWVMVSGQGSVRITEGHLDVGGDLAVNAAYVELPAGGRPTLSEDVIVVGREEKERDMQVSLDVQVDLGDSFYFQGAGIESRLAGQVRFVAAHQDQLRARGSVRTVGGTFDAYGQELAIERGILNFQGLVDNPGLNVRAVRKNLPVEAGVEVTGTLKSPKVRLVSDPDVPDTAKLSWMVLGRPPGEGMGAQDANLLLSAAMALRGGGQGEGPLKSLVQNLGLEEFSISSGTLGERSRFPTSHVAGSFNPGGAATAEQIATIGKRIGSNAILSYERSITTAESILKLTVELTRRFSLIGRIGANNAIGFLYSFAFGGKKPPGGSSAGDGRGTPSRPASR